MPSPPATAPPIRRRFAVHGVVQGVGFRPFVYLLARRHALSGHVRNVAGGVRIEVQGGAAEVAAFACTLATEPPPLAVLESIESEELAPDDQVGFRIVESDAGDDSITPVSPDIAVCDACLAELRNPADRRYRYPFINCTDCGPRFTLITGVPYDRPYTTMRAFVQCPRCAAEYADPASRRFHAQPNACPDCGPRLSWFAPPSSLASGSPQGPLAEVGAGETEAVDAPGGGGLYGEAALGAARALLARGGIVALKGIGGFHLACDATDDAAVERLRERKGRGEKPLAVMVRDLEAARRYALLSPEEERTLSARQRPILLLRKRPEPPSELPLSPRIAPGQGNLGLLLPYAPVHELLLGERPLVMTSGNRSDEPIARDNEEALERLAGLADGFLLHDRGIHMVCDDSVLRGGPEGEIPIRRSRGYAPLPVPLPFSAPPLLAVGGEIKATFCLARERRAFLSQHIGDMGNLETLQAFERALDHYLDLFRIAPELVACDLHPDYLSTRWAEGWAAARGLPLVRVQHHHAHIAAVLAEHGVEGGEPVLGIAFDGTGYGADGTLWGGEILLADYQRCRRLAWLKPVPMPGGEAAIRRPGRMALSYLRAAGIDWDPTLPCVAASPPHERRVLARQLDLGLGAPLTSSAGRLFDAVAALIGLRQEAGYEGQPAMELEALAGSISVPPEEAYRFDAVAAPGGIEGTVLDPAPLLRAIVADLAQGVHRETMAARFHAGLAGEVVERCRAARSQAGTGTVALSGGTFQNAHLLGLLLPALRAEGFRTLHHRLVPPNDGGLALGQAAIAAALSRRESGGAGETEKDPTGNGTGGAEGAGGEL